MRALGCGGHGLSPDGPSDPPLPRRRRSTAGDGGPHAGRGRANVFLTVTLPLALPGLLAGTVLGFARCLGEFGATITFAANIPGETRTIPLAIYSALQTPDGESAALRLVLLSILVSVLALAGSEWLARRLARRLGGEG